MSLKAPNLDDRTFEQLVEEAKRRIPERAPEWTDLSPSDPGVTLLELFAFLTETMIYRLNRLPEKAYVEFLRLMGVKLDPPHAAVVALRFSVEGKAERAIEIPRGTRAAVGKSGGEGEPVVFVTDRAARIAAGESGVEVTARHCEEVAAELVGVGTGRPGLRVQVKRAPVVAPLGGDGLDLVVGVETPAEELDERLPSILYGGKRFRVWREATSFFGDHGDRYCYVADRVAGTIQFAPAARLLVKGELTVEPAAMGEIPAAGREIRVWYRRGGGARGNAAPEVVDTLKDPIGALRVVNPRAATGGRDAETLENALVRGPQELRVPERTVTAADFQDLALRQAGGVARAKAVTKAQVWEYAQPGTVDLLLVPALPEAEMKSGRFGRQRLEELQSEAVRAEIERLVDERRPLGTRCNVSWARFKTIRVSARVVLYRQENAEAVRARLLERLYRLLSPLPNAVSQQGWSFGNAARAFHVYDCAAAEPGVKYVDQVRFEVDESPDRETKVVLKDPFQKGTWYASSKEVLYRTTNHGQGWEPTGRFTGEEVEIAAAHPRRAGWVAVVTKVAGEETRQRVWISQDCGESWMDRALLDQEVRDACWVDRAGEPALLLASDAGLYYLTARPGQGPVLVDLHAEAKAATPLYSVASGVNGLGQVCVMVAGQNRAGAWISRDGGKDRTFEKAGLGGVDARVVRMQEQGSRRFFWAGTASSGGDEGAGCLRYEFTGVDAPSDGWKEFRGEWTGGSCHALAMAGSTVLAATHHAGVLRLDSQKTTATWKKVRVEAGMPLRDAGRFHPVADVAGDELSGTILAGGPEGVYRSDDGGEQYRPMAQRGSTEEVTLPETWLFCSGEHRLEVVTEDEIR